MDPITQLLERQRITQVIHDYCRQIDDCRPASVAALFAPDAVFVTSAGRNGAARGRTAIEERVRKLLSSFEATSHHVSNISIDFQGPEQATAYTYLFAWHRFTTARPDGYLWGRYDDRFERTEAGWAIAERTLLIAGEYDFPFRWVPVPGRGPGPQRSSKIS